MNVRILALATCLLGALQALPAADAWPLAALKEKAKGETALGAWSIAGYGGRDDFPYLVDRTELKQAEPGRWTLPNPESGHLVIDAENLNFRSAGKRNDAGVDTWCGALVFMPKAAGSYAVSGKLTGLWADNDGGKTSLKWAAFRGKADGKKFKLIVTGDTGKDETVDLGGSDELKSVALATGETLVLTLFKNGHWGAGGGNITSVSIDKVAAKP